MSNPLIKQMQISTKNWQVKKNDSSVLFTLLLYLNLFFFFFFFRRMFSTRCSPQNQIWIKSMYYKDKKESTMKNGLERLRGQEETYVTDHIISTCTHGIVLGLEQRYSKPQLLIRSWKWETRRYSRDRQWSEGNVRSHTCILVRPCKIWLMHRA